MCPKIVVADNMEPEVLESLKHVGLVDYKPANLASSLSDADFLVVRSATKVTRELLKNARKLKVVARAGVGLDNIDSEACKERGIKVINTPGASTEAVAELAIGMMLCACRNLGRAHFGMKSGKWEKKELTGMELSGKTLGIIGYGRIGREVAKKAKAFGMNILAYDPHSQSDQLASIVPLDAVLESSHIISLHCVVTEETSGMINSGAISKMRDGIVLINVARGELVDEEAVYEACKSGKIRACALDVYSSEPYSGKLLELENVFFTPHIGAATKEAQEKIGVELIQKLKAEMV